MTAPAFDRELKMFKPKSVKYYSPTTDHKLRLANVGKKIRRS